MESDLRTVPIPLDRGQRLHEVASVYMFIRAGLPSEVEKNALANQKAP